MDKPVLGDYRIEGIVGVGRMGVVYLAIDRITGRAVALKVLREDVGVDPVYRARFRREGELLAQLNHPHIIPIHGMGEIDGELYLASRLVSSTLRSLILAGPIEVDVAMTILASLAGALDAAHAIGVVHRDVKPANVLIDPGPEVFLGDFGLARDTEGSQLTLPGQVLGTIDYMAPELLDGERVGAATDIYGLACLACETLTGTVPYVRDTDAATMYAHIVEPPPSVSERRPDLPKALDDVLAAGMAKDPRGPSGVRRRARERDAGRAGPPRRQPARPWRREGCDRLTRPDQQATAVGGEALNGRYEIVAPISSGAMGAVYRAIDRESGADVAVKRLLDVRHAARFEIEARLLASLSHPRVVKVLDHSSDEQGLLHRHGPRPRRRTSARSSSATARPGLTARRRDRVRPPRLRGAASTCTPSRSSTATSSRRT